MKNLPKITDRDLRDLAEEYTREGWTLEETGGGKIKWIPPGGDARHVVFTAKSARDHRAIDNIRRDLRSALRLAGKYPPPARAPIPAPKPLGVKVLDVVAKAAEEQRLFAKAQEVEPVKIPLAPIPASKETLPMPQEKPAIGFEDACRLVVDEIEKHGVFPPRATEAVFGLYRIKTFRNFGEQREFYVTAGSFHSAFIYRFPAYKTRNRTPGTPPPPTPASVTPAAVTYPQGLSPQSPAVSGLAEQLAHLAATPGLTEEKKRELISFFLKMP